MIIPNFTQFRATFSEYATWGPHIVAFSAATRRMVGVLTPTFKCGIQPGHRLQVVGSTSNDGWWTVYDLSDSWIEFVETPTDELAATVTLWSSYFDADGYARWPVSKVRLTGSGFGDTGSTFTGIPRPYIGRVAGIILSCNGGSASPDAVPGTDEYDWYVSQRSDNLASQMLELLPAPYAGPPTYSGTIRLVPNDALLSSETGVSWTIGNDLPRELLMPLFTRCHVYVQRRSDKAIQWVDLLSAQVAAV